MPNDEGRAWGAVALCLALVVLVGTSLVAIYAVAALTAASGLVVVARMYETHPEPARADPDRNDARTS